MDTMKRGAAYPPPTYTTRELASVAARQGVTPEKLTALYLSYCGETHKVMAWLLNPNPDFPKEVKHEHKIEYPARAPVRRTVPQLRAKTPAR